ncbi:hypothetical protein CCR85_08340 [Rhodothalassium salexigens]|uniref:polyhydroxyalkanoate depolymerase n=1 Tax=Rhodothalassium salexigens TaxID=1086 RepID=UPI0019137462|nr:polyhydroxyalkanoate depolymerase [Rhodothalassium salexigens]MBK5911497.1 hypothetical protein [Rhodothalassium salexigens]MBK5919676.1 hypothetical protein [Rhodothalassium salexigens]
MLYSLYELQHTAFAPMRYAVDQSQYMLRSPYNPFSFTPPGRMMAAAFDVIEQVTRRYGKPRFGLDTVEIDGERVRVEEETLERKPFGKLRHFVRHTDRDDPRLLIVAPMSGHFATLLRGTVERMLPHHDVYITDWRDARDIPLYEGEFDLDDYVNYLISWLTALGPNTHVMAVCQPAVPVMAAVSIMSAEDHEATPPSMTLMGGPIDTREAPTEVNEFAESRPMSWFENNVITHVPLPNQGAMRPVYPGFLQLAGFMAMNINDHMQKHYQMFRHLVEGDGESAEATRLFYEEYRSVMDLDAPFYLQTIDIVFKSHRLPKGEWVSRGRRVRPEKITRTAILCIEGERDDISGIGQTRAALDLATGLDDAKKDYLLAPKVGHYGIFNGRRWRETIAPRVEAFIRRHDQGARGHLTVAA